MAEDAIWERKFRGQNLSLSLGDLTVRRMRQIKAWFGDDYGIPAKFISLLLMGEIDALTAALWVHSEKVGDPIGAPLDYEFNLGEFSDPDKPKRRSAGKSQAGDVEDQTSSPETLTN